jgi:uncharacterized protein (TIGR02300 family)
MGSGKARALLIPARQVPINTITNSRLRAGRVGRQIQGLHMVKPEWGTKRTCPNCGTRFYDLNKEDPVTCIECGEEWTPEPVLKSKQPILAEDESKKKKDAEADSDLGGDDDDDLDIDIDEDDDSPDNEVDLGGDDDLGVETKSKGDDDDVDES